MNSEGVSSPGPVPPELFDEIYRRHGHRCPMSTLGARLGHAARGRLATVAASDLLAIYRIRTCALDGIEATCGCSRAAGTLSVVEEGRHALSLVHRGSGEGVTVILSEAALAIAGEYRRVSDALERERLRLSAEELVKREAQREAVLDQVLTRLRGEDDGLLLDIRPLVLPVESLLREGGHA